MTIQSITETAPAHVVQIKLSGTMTVKDVRDFMRKIETALEQHERIGIVVDVTQWSDMTADAIGADLKAEFSLLPKLRRIPRLAVLSNKQWYNAVIGWFRSLLFTTEIKVFDPEQANAEQDAIRFASEFVGEKAVTEQTPSIVRISTDRENLLAFEYRGHLRSEDIDPVLDVIKTALDREGQFDLLVRMDHFSGFDPSIMFKGSLLSVKLASFKKLRRYAIVGAGGWIEGAVKMFAPLVSIEMKTFDRDQENEAWAWLNS